MRSKMSLRELIDQIEWTQIKPVSVGRVSEAASRVSVGFYPSKKSDPTINEVRVRIGKDVMKELRWQNKDRICVYHHPEYVMQIKLVKSTNGNGFLLSPEGMSNASRINFRWTVNVPLEERRCLPVEFETLRDCLVLDMNQLQEM